MSNRAIVEAITKMTGQHKLDPVYYVNAEVISVDVAKRVCSCQVIEGQTAYELPTVKLMAVVDDGLLLEPRVGSTVKVIFSIIIEPFVCQYSELETVVIDARASIKFNDGSFGGLVKSTDLTDRINAIEDSINDLKTAFSSWIVIPSDGGAALKTATLKWQTESLEKTKVSDIENPKITHGK